MILESRELERKMAADFGTQDHINVNTEGAKCNYIFSNNTFNHESEISLCSLEGNLP